MATGWRCRIWAIGLLAGAALAEEARAEEAQAEEARVPNPYPDLVRTYYDYGVVEYCGLVDMPSHNGYALLRGDQIARGKVGRDADRRARIDADMAVDFEYQDRGLSGQKAWCKTEGASAYARFIAYFRTRQLP
jgi:hypothetical protein